MSNPIDDNEVSLHYGKMSNKSALIISLYANTIFAIQIRDEGEFLYMSTSYLFKNLPTVMSSILLRKEHHDKSMYF